MKRWLATAFVCLSPKRRLKTDPSADDSLDSRRVSGDAKTENCKIWFSPLEVAAITDVAHEEDRAFSELVRLALTSRPDLARRIYEHVQAIKGRHGM